MIIQAVPLWRPLDPLHYTSSDPLERGDLVRVPLGKEIVPACVVSTDNEDPQVEDGLKSISSIAAKAIFPEPLLQLAAELSGEYMGFIGEMLGLILPKEILLPPKRPFKSLSPPEPMKPAIRSDERKILEEIARSSKPVLLQSPADYTALVVALTGNVLERGKQVIMLLPDEPSLAKFCARFSKLLPVVQYHSKLVQAERRRVWHAVNQGSVRVVAGLRSAVLLPARNLGTILVFDADSSSYKERTHHLRYDAVDIALKRASAGNAPAVLFSPAPTIEFSHKSRAGKFLRIERRLKQEGKALIVDMKREGEGEVLSSTLKELIIKTFEARKQSLLVLNRLGTAARLICFDCGHVISCPTCSLPLRFVKPGLDLECALCRKRFPAPDRCPQCAGSRWRSLSPGITSLKNALGSLFSRARLLEITAERRPTLEDIENFDVIYGTSAVLEYQPPRIRTAALLSWDAERSRSDFRATEHAFRDVTYLRRLLSSSPDSRLVIQTFRTRDFALNWALRGDYESFFQSEIRKRRELGYPPYRRLVLFERTTSKNAWDADKLSAALARDGVEILGPYAGRNGRETLLVKLRRDLSPADLMDARTLLKSGWQAEVDPVEIM